MNVLGICAFLFSAKFPPLQLCKSKGILFPRELEMEGVWLAIWWYLRRYKKHKIFGGLLHSNYWLLLKKDSSCLPRAQYRYRSRSAWGHFENSCKVRFLRNNAANWSVRRWNGSLYGLCKSGIIIIRNCLFSLPLSPTTKVFFKMKLSSHALFINNVFFF